MKILVIDIGGTNVKLWLTGKSEAIRFPSGKQMVPSQMVKQIKELTKGWNYDFVSIGYPGVVKKNKIVTEPHNLGKGWIGFNFRKAFKKPVRMMNDAAMQALGSYRKGTMLFIGLGTGLGSAVVANGIVVPLEIGRLSYRSKTYGDYIGLRGLDRTGTLKWRQDVAFCIKRLSAAVHPDDVVIGGGNVRYLTRLPSGCRRGGNKFAFVGGIRMWKEYKT